MKYNFSPKNMNKPTPLGLKIIGNVLAMVVMGIQPLIVGAPDEILNNSMKFFWTLGLAVVGIVGKSLTMMFTEITTNGTNQENNGQN